eukprot:TRINITY_DN6958_c0_g1_i1.p1 TRINITY_DN6958_c0_g1~~TRINITY_DN6958_c0_g1_i1.p1  ORF type:complete len:510 (-),score=78.98 TRINITY_DN6958_c0_g1_i1:2-1531(-)
MERLDVDESSALLTNKGLTTDEDDQTPPVLSYSGSVVVNAPPVHTNAEVGFGEKDISFFGGFSLLVMNMTGPAMMNIPAIFQAAGWFTPVLLIVIMTVLSSFACTFLVEAMSNVPGNERFEGRAEVATLAKLFFPPWAYWLTQALLFISLQANNIAAIVVSAQVMDETLYNIFHWDIALDLTTFKFVELHRGAVMHGNSLFPETYIISLGFLIILALSIPLGYFNLDDNIIVQEICFVSLCVICIEWVIAFSVSGLTPSMTPVYTNVAGQGQVIGTIIFNYAFAMCIPSWVNEMKSGISINKSIWWSNVLSSVMFFAIGLFGAWFACYSVTNDILEIIPNWNKNAGMQLPNLITVYSFPLVSLVSGIPVLSIIIRYNLVKSGICRKKWANVWGVILPWVISVPFYTGTSFSTMINWVSLLVNGPINFIIPMLLYIISLKTKERNPPAKELEVFRAIPMWRDRRSRKTAIAMIASSAFLSILGIIVYSIQFADPPNPPVCRLSPPNNNNN